MTVVKLAIPQVFSIFVLSGLWSEALAAEVTNTCGSSEDTLTIQEDCAEQNDRLLVEEYNKNYHLVCQHLFELWECVGQNLPRCLDHYVDLYKSYHHSPSNCALTEEQIMKLQELRNKNEEKDVDAIVHFNDDETTVAMIEESSLATEADGHGSGQVNSHTGSDSSKTCLYSIQLLLSGMLAIRLISWSSALT